MDYKYDVGGRLLRRASSNSGTTYNYWLGLNKLAEERLGATQVAEVHRPGVREGAGPGEEETVNPTANGWCIYEAPAGSMAYVNSPSRGRVLRLQSGDSGVESGTFLLGETNDYNDNANDTAWGDPSRYVSLWLRNADPAHGPIRLGLLVRSYEGPFNLNFVTDSGDYTNESPCYYYDLDYGNDTNWNDGDWHYLELDTDTFGQLLLDHDVSYIDGLVVMGSDVYVDDVILSDGALERSYQVVPGAAIEGVLGAWKTNYQNQASSFYYHYNDLGTVISTTNKLGQAISVSEPDFFGSYRYVSGTRPDTMGITGMFYDNESGIYYGRARWYDSERGRWISKEPFGIDGPNLYLFNKNKPVHLLDPNGLFTIPVPIITTPDLRFQPQTEAHRKYCEWMCKPDNPHRPNDRHLYWGWESGYHGVPYLPFMGVGYWVEFWQGAWVSSWYGDDFFDDESGFNKDGSPKNSPSGGYQKGDIQDDKKGWNKGQCDAIEEKRCFNECMYGKKS